jgi:hypothetical protein
MRKIGFVVATLIALCGAQEDQRLPETLVRVNGWNISINWKDMDFKDRETRHMLEEFANTKTVCVITTHSYEYRDVVINLPDVSRPKTSLESDKRLRQMRGEMAEALTQNGFSAVDCINGSTETEDARLVVTDTGNGINWRLLSGPNVTVVYQGEKELFPLAGPGDSSWGGPPNLASSLENVAKNVRRVVDKVKAELPKHIKA